MDRDDAVHAQLAMEQYHLPRWTFNAVRGIANRIRRAAIIPEMEFDETDDETVDNWVDMNGQHHRNSRQHPDSPRRDVSTIFAPNDPYTYMHLH